MRWEKEPGPCPGEITYRVTDAQSSGRRLEELGFSYEHVAGRWSLTVHQAQGERIKKIEAFLRESQHLRPRPHIKAARQPTSSPPPQRSHAPPKPRLLHWQKAPNTHTGVVTYSVPDRNLVPNANTLRPALRDHSFLLYDKTGCWSVTVRAADAKRISRIEKFLAEAEKGLPPREDDAPWQHARPQREIAPSEPGRRRLTAQELVLIDALLRETSWIYPDEVKFLKSIRGHAQAGILLSARQIQVLQGMPEKIGRRKGPKFFQGGSPGLGKKR